MAAAGNDPHPHLPRLTRTGRPGVESGGSLRVVPAAATPPDDWPPELAALFAAALPDDAPGAWIRHAIRHHRGDWA